MGRESIVWRASEGRDWACSGCFGGGWGGWAVRAELRRRLGPLRCRVAWLERANAILGDTKESHSSCYCVCSCDFLVSPLMSRWRRHQGRRDRSTGAASLNAFDRVPTLSFWCVRMFIFAARAAKCKSKSAIFGWSEPPGGGKGVPGMRIRCLPVLRRDRRSKLTPVC